MRALAAIAAAGLAGCGDSPMAPDADPAIECAAIRQRWLSTVEPIDRSCVTADDCIVVAGGDCDGKRPSLGACHGTAFNRDAYDAALPEINEVLIGWDDCRCPLGCSLDCERGEARCEADVCVAYQTNSCFGKP